MKDVTFLKAGMENFCCHIDPMEIEFPKGKLTLITGPNGIGKTATIQSIPFSLYGICEKGSGDDVVNNKVGKNCRTWTEFMVDADHYRVDRYVKYKSLGNTVHLTKNHADKPYKTGQREVVPEIERLLLPKKLFMNTMLFSQKVKTFFTDLNDSEQKEIFRKILKLEEYLIFQQKTNAKIKQLLEDSQDLLNAGEVNKQLKEDIEARIIVHIKERDDFNIEKEEKIKELKVEIETAMVTLKQLEDELQEMEPEVWAGRQESINEQLTEYNMYINAIPAELVTKKDLIGSKKEQKASEFRTQAATIETQNAEEKNGLINKARLDCSNDLQECNGHLTQLQNHLFHTEAQLGAKESEIELGISDLSLEESGANNDARDRYLDKKEDLRKEIEKTVEAKSMIESKRDTAIYVAEDFAERVVEYKGINEDDECPTCLQEVSDMTGLNNQIKELENNEKKARDEHEVCEERIRKQRLYLEDLSQEVNAAQKFLEKEQGVIVAEFEKKRVTLRDELADYAEANEKVAAGYETQIIDENAKVTERTDRRDAEIKEIEADFLQRAMDNNDSLESAMLKLNQLYMDEIEEADTEAATLHKKYKDEQAEVSKTATEIATVLEAIVHVEGDVKEQEFRAASLGSDLAREEIAVYNETSLNDCFKKKQDLIKEDSEINKSISSIKKRHKILEFWKVGYSSAGIQSMLIDEAIPFMNHRASHYLEKLSNGRYSVSFDTMKATKSGEFRDKISVNVFDNITHAETRVQLSGGQERIVDIATILTLSDLQSNVQEIRFNIVLFDEIFDALDDVNIETVSKLLREVTRDKSMFIVSHRHIDQIEADEILNFH